MDVRAIAAQAIAEEDDSLPKFLTSTRVGHARLAAGEDLVLAGQNVFDECLKSTDSNIESHWNFSDGDLILTGQALGWFKGDLATLCRAERVALGFLGALSGIATFTQCYVRACEGTDAKIAAGPFTTPFLGDLQRSAVLAGGGVVHETGLGGPLITTNLCQLVGSLAETHRRLRENFTPITIECRSISEVKTALELGVDEIILVDVSAQSVGEFVTMIPASVRLCVAGRFHLDDIATIARAGVPLIRVDHLMTGAPSVELTLRLE